MRMLRITCAMCVFTLLAQVSGDAQAVNGTVVGNVTDSTGAVLPGATVTITDTGTNTSRSITTDANGYYAFPNLMPGNYKVGVEKQGFANVARGGVTLSVNSTRS